MCLVLAVLLGCGTSPPSKPRASIDVSATFIRDFAERLKTDPVAARRMLGPVAEFSAKPITEAEADRRAADFFLRASDVRIVDVLPGVPDDNGKQRPEPGRFTLVTRGTVTTLPQVIGTAAPSRTNLVNPDIIVEIREGQIMAMRTQLPLR
ncbi:MAG: hypothetical protein EBV06_11790 [Planctomycetia bacterium]|nr:hypothetical protein [Planctomycetia bacterium]